MMGEDGGVFMKEELNSIIFNEIESIENLLKELEHQHKCIVSRDVFGMEECVDKIQSVNKNVAVLEVQRRKLVGNRKMREIINEIGDKCLEDNFRKIIKLLEETRIQKETNEMLLRQGLSYTNRMLNIMNPGGNAPNTYNSYGKVKR